MDSSEAQTWAGSRLKLHCFLRCNEESVRYVSNYEVIVWTCCSERAKELQL